MADLLLELFGEEIPASMQAGAAENLKKLVTDAVVEHGLNYAAAVVYWTPRRLCLDLRGLSESSVAKIVEKKGPNVNAPDNAKLGFLRSAGLSDISEAKIVSIPGKGDFYFASYEQVGRSALEILSQIMPNIIKQFNWPKSMRWGASSLCMQSLRWVRPLQNILCILTSEVDGCQVVPFEIDGLQSNNYSFGHRFMSNGQPIQVRDFADYQSKLERGYVILDVVRRKNIIKSDAENLCFANGLQLLEDEPLLDEVANLVEFPVVMLGQFNKKFLAMPQKIIQTTIRENQKCFVTKNAHEASELANYFIICANIQTSDGGDLIIKGNEKVVHARLSDAEYFFTKDLEDTLLVGTLGDQDKYAPLVLDLQKPLDQRMAVIVEEGIVFYKQLGTQGQRVERLVQLSLFIASKLFIDDLASVSRAASLAKADLVTYMVPEFPALQGYVGREYAIAQGETAEVAATIEEHYKPQGQKDKVPKSALSVSLALADKIDSLVGFWLINEKPTGSRDPFALRRAALGVVRLVLSRSENIFLLPILEYSEKLFLHQLQIPQQVISPDLLEFIVERFKGYVQSEGAKFSIIDAVMVNKEDNLLAMARKIEALIVFLDKDIGKNFYAAIKRVANILTNITGVASKINVELLREKEEKYLFEKLQIVQKKLLMDLHIGDFSGAFEALALLSEPIEDFFNNLLVEDKMEAIKLNRLALLEAVLGSAKQLADFSKIIY